MFRGAQTTGILLSLTLLATLFAGARGSGFAQEIFVAHPALTFGDIPYYIGKEKNFYRDEGIQVKDLYIRGGVTASQALQAGSVHFTLALGTGVRAALSGMTIKAIMVYCDKPYHFLYARPDLGVRNAADLKGKRIAVTGLGSTTYYATRKVVEHLGLDSDRDVRILSVGDIWPALAGGSVEAGLIRPPFTNMAQKMGMVRLGYVGDAIQMPMSGLVTSERLIQQQPDLVRRFVRGTHKGLKFFLDKKNEAESITALNRVTKMEPDVAKQTYDFYYSIMTRDGIPSERALIDDFELARLMLPKAEIQNVTRQQAEQKMYDFRLLKEIIKG
ncbi:MAG TPA: ABC transporter substrate-binding protein [Candidatus Binatia bacterium]|nr:ABC transporter substrate-binding protein [Candidatus Binatia bacterium]